MMNESTDTDFARECKPGDVAFADGGGVGLKFGRAGVTAGDDVTAVV